MKIIVSHDIDHITAFEHKNLIIPKSIIRATIEVLNKKITLKEYYLRYKELSINKWNNIDEIIEFNNKENVPATFFIGVNNGVGLDYSLEHSFKWAKHIMSKKFDVGVHGISYENYLSIKKEHSQLKDILNIDSFGIRMHYLRQNKDTFKNLEKSNYLFDSTLIEDINPFKIGSMWEFPLHIMDGHIMYQGKRWITKSLDEYKLITKKRIEELINKDINYMTLLFHDRYFNNSFLIWKEWYIWIIDYLKSLGCEFISYNNAIKELELNANSI